MHREIGPGLLEAVYQEALAIEFGIQGIPFTERPLLKIRYENHILKKEYIPDFICFGEIVVEIKSTKMLAPVDEAQILNSTLIADKKLGLLINFGEASLVWKRFVV